MMHTNRCACMLFLWLWSYTRRYQYHYENIIITKILKLLITYWYSRLAQRQAT